MLAVIEASAPARIRLLPIADRPLLIRQIEWLRANAFDAVAIEVASEGGEEILSCLRSTALSWDVVPVLTNSPAGAAEVARRAGFPEGAPLLAIPGDVVGSGDLVEVYRRAATPPPLTDVVVELRRPPFLPPRTPPASLRLYRGSDASGPAIVAPGWGTAIASVAQAITLGAAALDGRATKERMTLLIHAAETAPGIWVARGGRIYRGAEVIPPVLVGPGAIVRPGARVGPRVFLGERAVIHRGAVLRDAIVAPETVVGEGVAAESVHVLPSGVWGAGRTAAFEPVDDPLVLAHRNNQLGWSAWTRWLGLLLLTLSALTLAVWWSSF